MARRPIIAFCDRCMGTWLVHTLDPVDALEGVCVECREESDIAERPLEFREPEDLPDGWLL